MACASRGSGSEKRIDRERLLVQRPALPAAAGAQRLIRSRVDLRRAIEFPALTGADLALAPTLGPPVAEVFPRRLAGQRSAMSRLDPK